MCIYTDILFQVAAFAVVYNQFIYVQVGSASGPSSGVDIAAIEVDWNPYILHLTIVF